MDNSKNKRNPYDTSNGGVRAMVKKVFISRPSKYGPYVATKTIIKYEQQMRNVLR